MSGGGNHVEEKRAREAKRKAAVARVDASLVARRKKLARGKKAKAEVEPAEPDPYAFAIGFDKACWARSYAVRATPQEYLADGWDTFAAYLFCMPFVLGGKVWDHLSNGAQLLVLCLVGRVPQLRKTFRVQKHLGPMAQLFRPHDVGSIPIFVMAPVYRRGKCVCQCGDWHSTLWIDQRLAPHKSGERIGFHLHGQAAPSYVAGLRLPFAITGSAGSQHGVPVWMFWTLQGSKLPRTLCWHSP